MSVHATSIGLFLTISLLLTGRAEASCIGLDCSCSIDADDVAFGSYNALEGSNVDVTGMIGVTCGATVLGAAISYEIRLSSGGSGDASSRNLSNGGNTLAYNFYTAPSRATIWGDGTGGTGVITNGYVLNIIFSRTDNFSVYARLPPGQLASAGTYSDSITATVIF